MYCPSVLFFWVLLIYWQMCSKVEFEKKKKVSPVTLHRALPGGLIALLEKSFLRGKDGITPLLVF